MKKRFISLVAAAALVGGIAIASTPATSQAGTVAVKGDTAVTMYGFIHYELGWSNKMDTTTIYNNFPDEANNKTTMDSNAMITRIGFTFKNADANVCGRIEGDFWGGQFRLRRAYVKHSFDNFYALIGQEWGVEIVRTFSAGWWSPAGFNGHSRMPQIQLGTSLDLGGASLNLAVAFEDKSYTTSFKRAVVPGIAAHAKVGIDTGFGAPASVYAFGLATPMKITSPVDGSEKSETPVAFGAGFVLPVSMVTLQAEYIYGKGMNGFAGSDYTPDSYYNDGGSVKSNKFDAYNIEAKVAPTACVSVAGGYDYLKFKKLDKTKVETYFANVSLKTTKYTSLVLEWDHTKATASGENSQKGNKYWLGYHYSF